MKVSWGSAIGRINRHRLSNKWRHPRTPHEEGAADVHFVWGQGKNSTPRDDSQTLSSNPRTRTVCPSAKVVEIPPLDCSRTIKEDEKWLYDHSALMRERGRQPCGGRARTQDQGEDTDGELNGGLRDSLDVDRHPVLAQP